MFIMRHVIDISVYVKSVSVRQFPDDFIRGILFVCS